MAGQRVGIRRYQSADAVDGIIKEISAGVDADHVGAQAFYTLQRALLGTFTQRDHRHHRSNAENDAGHGQCGTQAMGIHGLQRHL
ncbi:hypothetical protein D3C75_797950 [compost metagenome]